MSKIEILVYIIIISPLMNETFRNYDNFWLYIPPWLRPVAYLGVGQQGAIAQGCNFLAATNFGKTLFLKTDLQ